MAVPPRPPRRTETASVVSLYYRDDAVTIFHGDWRDHPEWLTADVLVTDPPYGLADGSRRTESTTTAPWVGTGQAIVGDEDTVSRDGVLAAWGTRPALVFGSWQIERPSATRTVLVWDKGGHQGMGDLSVPWKPNWDEIYVLGQGFHGPRTTGVLSGFHVPSRASAGRCHPHEKPVRLLRDLIAKCPPGIIADPFMGSGSTLRAAKDLGRKAIGVELDERYCEIAVQRLAQEVLAF